MCSLMILNWIMALKMLNAENTIDIDDIVGTEILFPCQSTVMGGDSDKENGAGIFPLRIIQI